MRQVDVLTLDVILCQPLLCIIAGTGLLVADVEEAHGQAFQPLHTFAVFQHAESAGTAAHIPEVKVECIPLVRFYEALEDSVSLGGGVSRICHFSLSLLDILTVAVQGMICHYGIVDERDDGGEAGSHMVGIGILVDAIFSEHVLTEHHLLHESYFFKSVARRDDLRSLTVVISYGEQRVLSHVEHSAMLFGIKLVGQYHICLVGFVVRTIIFVVSENQFVAHHGDVYHDIDPYVIDEEQRVFRYQHHGGIVEQPSLTGGKKVIVLAKLRDLHIIEIAPFGHVVAVILHKSHKQFAQQTGTHHLLDVGICAGWQGQAVCLHVSDDSIHQLHHVALPLWDVLSHQPFDKQLLVTKIVFSHCGPETVDVGTLAMSTEGHSFVVVLCCVLCHLHRVAHSQEHIRDIQCQHTL